MLNLRFSSLKLCFSTEVGTFFLRGCKYTLFFWISLVELPKKCLYLHVYNKYQNNMTQDIKTEKTTLETKEQHQSDIPDLSQFDFPEDYDVWEDENLDMIP